MSVEKQFDLMQPQAAKSEHRGKLDSIKSTNEQVDSSSASNNENQYDDAALFSKSLYKNAIANELSMKIESE